MRFLPNQGTGRICGGSEAWAALAQAPDQVGINSACDTGSRSAQPLRQAPLEARLPKISRGKQGKHGRPYVRVNENGCATKAEKSPV